MSILMLLSFHNFLGCTKVDTRKLKESCNEIGHKAMSNLDSTSTKNLET